MKESVVLVGLPGSGKSRFKNQLELLFQQQPEPSLNLQPVKLIELDEAQTISPTLSQTRVWCVIDVRSPLHHEQAEAVLLHWLSQSSAIIFAFVEASDLVTQAYWQNWLKQHQISLPVYRWFSYGISETFDWKTLGNELNNVSLKRPEIEFQCFSVEVGRLHLEHLLFGLDAIKQNLGAQLWRVKADVQVQEYQNPVSIEGTINRWDTFAAEALNNRIEILGCALDEQLLLEIIHASEPLKSEY